MAEMTDRHEYRRGHPHVLGDSSYGSTEAFLRGCFEDGLTLYYRGHQPAWVHVFLPAGAISDSERDEAFAIIERHLTD